MSYIPNAAMPHALAEAEPSGTDWRETARQYLDQAREFARQGLELARRRPRETAAAGAVGGVALLAGLAYAAWRSRSRRLVQV